MSTRLPFFEGDRRGDRTTGASQGIESFPWQELLYRLQLAADPSLDDVGEIGCADRKSRRTFVLKAGGEVLIITNGDLVDNEYSAPGAYGWGLNGADEAVNSKSGLPAGPG